MVKLSIRALTKRFGEVTAVDDVTLQLEAGKFLALLPKIRQPTLILWGARDRLIPIAAARVFAQEIPGSRLVTFETLGHVPQEEDPQATLAPVKTFLDSINNKT